MPANTTSSPASTAKWPQVDSKSIKMPKDTPQKLIDDGELFWGDLGALGRTTMTSSVLHAALAKKQRAPKPSQSLTPSSGSATVGRSSSSNHKAASCSCCLRQSSYSVIPVLRVGLRVERTSCSNAQGANSSSTARRRVRIRKCFSLYLLALPPPSTTSSDIIYRRSKGLTFN